MRPLPWHRRYNFFLIWPLVRCVLIWVAVCILSGGLMYVTSHWFAEIDARIAASKYGQQEHAENEAMIKGLREMSRNGSLTATDIEEHTVCMADLRRIGK